MIDVVWINWVCVLMSIMVVKIVFICLKRMCVMLLILELKKLLVMVRVYIWMFVEWVSGNLFIFWCEFDVRYVENLMEFCRVLFKMRLIWWLILKLRFCIMFWNFFVLIGLELLCLYWVVCLNRGLIFLIFSSMMIKK